MLSSVPDADDRQDVDQIEGGNGPQPLNNPPDADQNAVGDDDAHSHHSDGGEEDEGMDFRDLKRRIYEVLPDDILPPPEPKAKRSVAVFSLVHVCVGDTY